MKSLKKISPTAWQYLLMGVILLGFLYVFYHGYELFAGYQAGRVEGKEKAAGVTQVAVPQFHDFKPTGGDKYRLFTFKMKKPVEAKLPPGVKKKIAKKSADYEILGVVKTGRLYLAVRYKSTQKIKLLPQGENIGGGHKIKSLRADRVQLVDKGGQEWSHKVFKFKDIKEIPYNNKKKK